MVDWTLLAWMGIARKPIFIVTPLVIKTAPHIRLYKGSFIGGSVTSVERHERRYQRRKQQRYERKAARNRMTGSYDEVFSFDNLYEAYRKSRKNVLWKSSVQAYKANALANIVKTHDALVSHSYRSRGFVEFDLIERGKPRHIKSVHVSERVVQRCLCDNCLVPLLRASFIHDNGASLSGKGIDFSMNRLSRHMREYYRKHGDDGYVLLFDFSKYFDSANHQAIFNQYKRNILDSDLVGQAEYFIHQFGSVGMGLGSQVSQISALALPNPLDHYVKEKLRIRHYGRYMDDGYLIHLDKEYLQHCLVEIEQRCRELGITLNRKKTQIVKLSHGFTFLKTKFFYSSTGAVIRKVNPKAITKMRRKLRVFKKWLIEGKMTMEDIRTSYQSCKGHVMRCNSHTTLKSMDVYFESLFGGDVYV